jgi:hypothetical protein
MPPPIMRMLKIGVIFLGRGKDAEGMGSPYCEVGPRYEVRPKDVLV